MVTIMRFGRHRNLFKVILFSTILLTVAMVCLSCFDVWSLSVGWSFDFGLAFLGLSTFFLSFEKWVLFLGAIIICFLFVVVSLIILIGDFILKNSDLYHGVPSTCLSFWTGLLAFTAFFGIFEFVTFAFFYFEKRKRAKRLH